MQLRDRRDWEALLITIADGDFASVEEVLALLESDPSVEAWLLRARAIIIELGRPVHQVAARFNSWLLRGIELGLPPGTPAAQEAALLRALDSSSLDEALALAERLANTPWLGHALLLCARRACEARSYEVALEAAQRASQQLSHRDQNQALRAVGAAHLGLGNTRAALEVLVQAMRQELRPHGHQGSFIHAGDSDPARQAVLEAIWATRWASFTDPEWLVALTGVLEHRALPELELIEQALQQGLDSLALEERREELASVVRRTRRRQTGTFHVASELLAGIPIELQPPGELM